MTTFGKKLVKWMEENNVVLKDLAARCDVTRQSVSSWVKGGNIHRKHRNKIKEITGIDFDEPETPVISEPIYVPFVMREIVAVRKNGCVGCLFNNIKYEEDECAFLAQKITGLMCSKDNVIFKLKEQWIPCPIDVEEGETVRNATSKLTFEVVSSPITFGTKYRGKMIVKNEHGDELMVNHADFEVEA